MNKYQQLNELCFKMIARRVRDRVKSCREILNEKLKWALLEIDFDINNYYQDFCDNCEEDYNKESHTFKLLKQFCERSERVMKRKKSAEPSSSKKIRLPSTSQTFDS